MYMPSIFGERLFDDFFEDFDRPFKTAMKLSTPQTGLMRTDIREKDGSFELDIDLPGCKKEDIKAELKDGYLTVTAVTKKEEENDENGKYIRRERYFGSCSRSFYVGEALTQEDIQAKFEDGILKISVPKKEYKPEIEQPKYIAIG
ncbi:MAG: Hsp20/alpha crystallin family protein [Firmicutes bacterium]|nr:Hsp20/alpha crystallin family protein [Bacillota bacterium]